MPQEKIEEKQDNSHENKIHKERKKGSLTEKIRKNPWMLATFICGFLILILFFTAIFNGSLSFRTISAKQAGNNLLAFYENLGVQGLSIVSVKEVSGLYQVTLSYQGQDIPVYMTKDGKNIAESFTPLEIEDSSNSPQETPEEIPKSDKPVVDLYVMSFCPYGVRAENNIFSIVDLFKDKIKFNMRFIANVNGNTVESVQSLHGLYEAKEDLRQLAISNKYPDKFYAYLKEFNSKCYQYSGDEAQIETCWKQVASSLNIDTKKIETLAYSKEGLDLLKADKVLTDKYDVSGSPTLIINGVKSDSIYSGTPSTQAAICAAFNQAPQECNTKLESTQQTTSGSC